MRETKPLLGVDVAIPIGITVTQLPSPRFVYCNSVSCDLLGYSRSELLSKSLLSLLHPEDVSLTESALVRLMSSQVEELKVRSRLCCKNDSWILIEMILSIVRDDFGYPLYGLGIWMLP